MGKQKNKSNVGSSTIALNKKAQFDYFLSERFEAGLVLEGWEVKSLRQSRIQLKESYVLIKSNEIWLFGAHISPLTSASTHITPDPIRTRKLLLHNKEINHLVGAVERRGFTIMAVAMYWKGGKVKLEIAIGKGKKLHDKRAVEKERDWNREKQRIFKDHT